MEGVGEEKKILKNTHIQAVLLSFIVRTERVVLSPNSP